MKAVLTQHQFNNSLPVIDDVLGVFYTDRVNRLDSRDTLTGELRKPPMATFSPDREPMRERVRELKALALGGEA